MSDIHHLRPDNSIRALRDGIRRKYSYYQAQDRDRFPTIDYNTSRANYEPLRTSFEHELFIVKGIAQTSLAIRIPSTTTLALLFTDDQYIPSPKILTACQLYAEGSDRSASIDKGIALQTWTSTFFRRRLGWLLTVSILLIGGSLVYYYLLQYTNQPSTNTLVIHRPKSGQVVPRLLYVEGKALNTDTVWLFVQPVNTEEYYGQVPMPVSADGTWKGHILIGLPSSRTDGFSFDIRAFSGLASQYKVVDTSGNFMLDSWPEHAVRSTEAIRVIRGKARY